MSVERQWRTTGSLGAKPYPPLEQSATALDQLRLVIQKLEIRDSIQLLNWKTLPEIPRQQCISVRTDCIFMYYILYNDNYNKYIYIYCLLAVILPSYVNSVHNMANHQMINPKMSAVSLSSVQDMEVGSAPVESTNTWAPGVSFQLLGGAQAPKKKVVFEKHVPWSTCNGLIRFMVIHPIIGILVLGVCVWGGYIERSLLMDWWPSPNMGIIWYYFTHLLTMAHTHSAPIISWLEDLQTWYIFWNMLKHVETTTSSIFDTASSLIQRHLLRGGSQSPTSQPILCPETIGVLRVESA